MERDYQQELLERLASTLESGIASVVDEATLIRRMEDRFPMGLNRIDWGNVPRSTRHPVPSPKVLPTAYWATVSRYLEEFASEAGVSNDQPVYILRDNLTHIGFAMPFSALKTHLADFLSIPQATYIMTEKVDWCFNYTFEDEVCFGPTPWL